MREASNQRIRDDIEMRNLPPKSRRGRKSKEERWITRTQVE